MGHEGDKLLQNDYDAYYFEMSLNRYLTQSWLGHLKMHRLGGTCGATKDHILAKDDQYIVLKVHIFDLFDPRICYIRGLIEY